MQPGKTHQRRNVLPLQLEHHGITNASRGSKRKNEGQLSLQLRHKQVCSGSALDERISCLLGRVLLLDITEHAAHTASNNCVHVTEQTLRKHVTAKLKQKLMLCGEQHSKQGHTCSDSKCVMKRLSCAFRYKDASSMAYFLVMQKQQLNGATKQLFTDATFVLNDIYVCSRTGNVHICGYDECPLRSSLHTKSDGFRVCAIGNTVVDFGEWQEFDLKESYRHQGMAWSETRKDDDGDTLENQKQLAEKSIADYTHFLLTVPAIKELGQQLPERQQLYAANNVYFTTLLTEELLVGGDVHVTWQHYITTRCVSKFKKALKDTMLYCKQKRCQLPVTGIQSMYFNKVICRLLQSDADTPYYTLTHAERRSIATLYVRHSIHYFNKLRKLDPQTTASLLSPCARGPDTRSFVLALLYISRTGLRINGIDVIPKSNFLLYALPPLAAIHKYTEERQRKKRRQQVRSKVNMKMGHFNGNVASAANQGTEEQQPPASLLDNDTAADTDIKQGMYNMLVGLQKSVVAIKTCLENICLDSESHTEAVKMPAVDIALLRKVRFKNHAASTLANLAGAEAGPKSD